MAIGFCSRLRDGMRDRGGRLRLRVEVVFREKRKVLRAGTNGVFDEVDDLLVGEGFGLLDFRLAHLALEFFLAGVLEVGLGAVVEVLQLDRELLVLGFEGDVRRSE